jgi:hypothetical protein
VETTIEKKKKGKNVSGNDILLETSEIGVRATVGTEPCSV